MNQAVARAEICRIGRLLWECRHVGAVEGNLSCRIDEGTLLCTPTGKSKGDLTPSDLVLTDLEGKSLDDGQPSSEIQLHLECYASRPDCQAVIHAHPPYATAFALAGETVPDNMLPEAAVFLGRVALVPFAMPGTPAMRDAIRPYLALHKTFLLQNHGAVALGADLQGAWERMDTLERVAAAIYRARKLGDPLTLPASATSKLRDYFNAKL